MKIVTRTDELEEICAALAQSEYVCVDTEFMREKTFWPELCLIQIAGGEVEAIIDPLAKDIDLAPFFRLMRNESVVKVLHAARQDMEIFHNLSGQLPAPVFDTQIAAMVCGFGDQVGYADLVQKLLGITLDKSSRFSDWRRRPLQKHQLTYALADVTYLAKAYPLLVDNIEKAGRSAWIHEEMAALTDPDLYAQHPENAWRRLKLRNVKNSRLGILMELARWREETAQRKNLPRNHVVKDDVLYEVANRAPQNEQELSELRSITKGLLRSSYGRQLLDGVRRGQQIDNASLPKIRKNPRLSIQAQGVFELLKVFLRTTAAQHKVAARIIASQQDLELLAMDDKADIPALKGWRRKLFGEQALALKHGRACLGLKKGRIELFPLQDGAVAANHTQAH